MRANDILDVRFIFHNPDISKENGAGLTYLPIQQLGTKGMKSIERG